MSGLEASALVTHPGLSRLEIERKLLQCIKPSASTKFLELFKMCNVKSSALVRLYLGNKCMQNFWTLFSTEAKRKKVSL